MAKYVSSLKDFMGDVVYAESTSWEEKGTPVEDYVEFLLGAVDALRNDVEVVHIEQDGGGEGGGEHCYTIFKIGNDYYKVEYSYYSYQGFDTDYAEVYLVTPQEKTITVYE